MADLNLYTVPGGLRIVSEITDFVINEFSTKRNNINKNELTIVSHIKSNYAEYTIDFGLFDIIYLNSVQYTTALSLQNELQKTSSSFALKINGRNTGTLFGDDIRTTSKKPVVAGMWSHGLPLNGLNITINGSGKWYIPEDSNASGFPDGISIFETGTDSDGKIFITSVENRYEPGSLSYFVFTMASNNIDSSNGNFVLLFGAMSRGVNTEGNYDQIKEGQVIGFIRDNGTFKHVLRVYKNFQFQEQEVDYEIGSLEYLKILRLEVGYLGIHPFLNYKVNFDNLQDELIHSYLFKQGVTSVANPNLSLGVYIENQGNTANLQISNGSLQFGNYSERPGADPSARDLIDSFESASIASGTDTVLAVYTLPELLTMYDSIDSTGIAGATTRDFYNTIANKLNSIKATGTANKPIYVNVYIVPKSDVTATYTPLKPYVNALERATGAAITSVSLTNANKIGFLVLGVADKKDNEDVSSKEILLRSNQVGVITVSCSQSITDFTYTIFTSDLF